MRVCVCGVNVATRQSLLIFRVAAALVEEGGSRSDEPFFRSTTLAGSMRRSVRAELNFIFSAQQQVANAILIQIYKYTDIARRRTDSIDIFPLPFVDDVVAAGSKVCAVLVY